MSNNEKVNLKALREVVARNNFIVFDTETTGLKSDAEIVQIAAVHSKYGKVIDTLVKPTMPIPADATAVHKITTEMAESDGKMWCLVYEALMDVIELYGCEIVSYNLSYDSRMIVQTCKAHAVFSDRWLNYIHKRPGACAMLAYAEHHGVIDERFGTYRWQRLSEAAEQQSIIVKDAHAAMGDVLMTAALCQKMAKEPSEEQVLIF